MSDKLTALSKYSKIWADTMDLPSSLHFHPEGATSNPFIVLANLGVEHNKHFVKEAADWVKHTHGAETKERQVQLAVLKCMVSMGVEMAKNIPGLVNTQVDCRLAQDTEAIVKQSLEIVKLYEDAGVPRSRVGIKIPATWEGIQACKQLSNSHHVNCNMTTMFALPQAVASAEAGAAIISPYLNRIAAHFGDTYNPKFLPAAEHVDLPFVKKLYNYYKQNNIKTILLGASIKHTEELELLCGLDAITIFPPHLERLSKLQGDIKPEFTVEGAKQAEPIPVRTYINDEAKFREDLKLDERSSTYLGEAIATFVEYDIKLAQLIAAAF